jgi:GT2 family glycosyltransferase
MAKLYIVTPVVNCLYYTRNMVSSIRTSYPFKLIIVDNDSRDGTDRYCQDQQIECIRNVPRRGVSASWNQGIRRALADPECGYIFVPNNDVIFHEKTIDNLIRFLDKTDYLMATGNNCNGHIALEQLKDLNPPDFDEHDLQPITNWREEGPDFSCFMITPKTIEKVGFFDENFEAFCEDNDFHYRIWLAGGHARRISTAPYFHYGSMTLAENPGLGVSTARSMPYFLKKWGTTPEQCMDGRGFKTPFSDPNKTLKDW